MYVHYLKLPMKYWPKFRHGTIKIFGTEEQNFGTKKVDETFWYNLLFTGE